MTELVEVTPVKVGDVVHVIDETYKPHKALVTCVHGKFPGEDDAPSTPGYEPAPGYVPCINVVYVSDDPAKRDPYGAQVERMSSLQHYNVGPNGMPKPGRYWINL